MGIETTVPASDRNGETFAVLETLNRYLHAIDLGDIASLESCFALDATGVYGGVLAGRCRREIIGYLIDRGVGSTKGWAASMHAMANWSIRIDGSSATAESLVEAVLIDAPPGSGRTMRRGLRYSDELINTDGIWRIQKREHRLLWLYDVGGVTIP